MFQSSRTDNAIALSAMPPASIIAYQKLMGPYITDEVFLYLIHLFEMLSGVRDPVPLETAVSEARHHLAPLTVMPRVLRDVYSVCYSCFSKTVLVFLHQTMSASQTYA